MAITITKNLNDVHDASTATGWTADGNWGSLATDSAVFREGGSALRGQVSQAAGHVYYTLSSVDLTAAGNERIYAWILPPGSFDTIANGGLRIVVGDGTNRAAYYVGGSDVNAFAVGAWICVVLDTANLPSNFATLAGSEASIDFTAVTQIGIGISNPAKATGNSPNAWFDIVRYGSGLTITGGSSGDPGTFAEIAAADASTASGAAYGIVREVSPGVYGVQGSLTWGDAGGSSSFYFADENAVVAIEDRVLGAGTPTDIAFAVVGNGTATTQHFELGVPVGTGDTQSGRRGVLFKNTNLAQPMTWDASDADLDEFECYGCTWDGFVKTAAGQDVTFSADATLGPNHVLSGCTFSQCGQVDVGRVPTRNCVFSGYAGTDGALLWSTNINIKNCQFLGNADGTNDPAGIEHPSSAGTPYTYDGLTFSGNDFDAYNSSGSGITVNLTNGANASTSRGSSVSFVAAFTHTVTQLQAGERVVWIRVSDDVELENQAASGGQAQYSYNYAGGVDVYVSILSLTRKTKSPIVTLTNANATLPAALDDDPFYFNPP